MIRKLALFAGAAFIAKRWLDRSRTDGSAYPRARALRTEPSSGHEPTDLLVDHHPDGSVRADEHFRPDPTAAVSPQDRESLRPVTMPAPHDPPGH